MPRKFAEWQVIRDNYYKATKQQFPFPGKQSVVYDWESENYFWEARRKNAATIIGTSHILFNENNQELAALGERVKNQGLAERKKEIDFLNKALPDFIFNNITDRDLIIKLNEIISGAEQYANALNRIKAALDKSKKTDTKSLGPSAATLFTSYLGTELSQIFYNFIAQPKIKDPFSAWTAYFEQHINEAIDKAVKAMTEDIGSKGEVNDIYGDADQWRAIGEAYRTIEGFSNQFQNMIKNKIDFTKAAEMFLNKNNQSIYRKARRGNKKSGYRTYIDEVLHLRTRAGQIGGSVEEYINDLIARIAPKGGHITEKGTTVIQSEKTTVDRVGVYYFEVEGDISAQRLAEMISESLDGADSLKESAQLLEDFYNRNLKNLNNAFVIYGSDKLYKLDSDFSGFHNGGAQPLSRLPDYIESAGVNASVGMDFVYTAYNTLPTAIYAGERAEIQEQITNVLTAAAAKLLFNDWATVGVETEGAQALHIFNLDGVLVPISYLLINLGEAMIKASGDMKRFFSVSVSLPETVVYHPGDWHKFGKGDENIKNQLYAKWQEQFQKAEKESYFSTKFLSNFKSLMSSLI